ncbi:MAG: protein-disulfide reductase DsbD domain-containing protein [Candidatus Acidiferrales bacterium]
MADRNSSAVWRWAAGAAAIVTLAVLGICGAQTARAQTPARPQVDVGLVSDATAVRAGQTLWVGLQFKLQSGWHIYWENPGDSGEPPKIQWDLPTGFHAGDFLWPYPERIEAPSIVDYGYSNGVVLMAPVTVAGDLPAHGSVTLGGQVHYLVCREICVPAKASVQLALPVAARASAALSNATVHALFEQTRQRLPLAAPAAWQARVKSSGNEFILSLRSGKSTTQAEFFPLDSDVIENSAAQNVQSTPTGIEIHMKKSDQLLKPIARLRGVVVLPERGAYSVDAPVTQ